MGRNVPLRIWGPSGEMPELGTAYALDHMQKMLTWDLAGRAGNVDFRGYRMEVNEFATSSRWNGLKFDFSSDTYPNKWFDKYARGADLVVHECFIAVPDLVNKMKFSPESALLVGTQVHTAPEAFGKVMSAIKPRMAVA